MLPRSHIDIDATASAGVLGRGFDLKRTRWGPKQESRQRDTDTNAWFDWRRHGGNSSWKPSFDVGLRFELESAPGAAIG
jgi:hypothetical protein